jgi:hypothetical protein
MFLEDNIGEGFKINIKMDVFYYPESQKGKKI